MLPVHDLLEGFLNTPLRITCLNRDTFTGHLTTPERIKTNRLIRLLRGKLTYSIDQKSLELKAGSLFFVPRNASRRWEVAEGEIMEILWCEFDSPSVHADPHMLYVMEDKKPGLEKAALLRMSRLWTFPRHLRGGVDSDPDLPPTVALRMEGELKACLARFWCEAKPWKAEPAGDGPASVHPAVRLALQWMEENFRLPEAQALLYREVVNLSPNHFRLLFSKYVGASVRAHLLKLRMLEAMNLLRTSSLSIKEVSALVGFNDALYFSRRFREHWGIPPTAVRR